MLFGGRVYDEAKRWNQDNSSARRKGIMRGYVTKKIVFDLISTILTYTKIFIGFAKTPAYIINVTKTAFWSMNDINSVSTTNPKPTISVFYCCHKCIYSVIDWAIVTIWRCSWKFLSWVVAIAMLKKLKRLLLFERPHNSRFIKDSKTATWCFGKVWQPCSMEHFRIIPTIWF